MTSYKTPQVETVSESESPFLTATDVTALMSVQGKSALLIEDSEDTRLLLGRALKMFGIEVIEAENGLKGLKSATAAHPPDVILMDLEMPVLNGFEATRRLREIGFSGPIIAISAHTGSDEKRRCLELGFDEYLPKPVNRIRLLYSIAHHLRITESGPTH